MKTFSPNLQPKGCRCGFQYINAGMGHFGEFTRMICPQCASAHKVLDALKEFLKFEDIDNPALANLSEAFQFAHIAVADSEKNEGLSEEELSIRNEDKTDWEA